MLNILKRLLVEEDGPTAVEYAVMLALVITVCLGTIQILGSRTTASFQNMSNSLNTMGS